MSVLTLAGYAMVFPAVDYSCPPECLTTSSSGKTFLPHLAGAIETTSIFYSDSYYRTGVVFCRLLTLLLITPAVVFQAIVS